MRRSSACCCVTPSPSRSRLPGGLLFPEPLALHLQRRPELVALWGKVMPIFSTGIWAFGAQMAFRWLFMAMPGQDKPVPRLLRKVILLVTWRSCCHDAQDVMGIYVAEPVADILASATSPDLFLPGGDPAPQGGPGRKRIYEEKALFPLLAAWCALAGLLLDEGGDVPPAGRSGLREGLRPRGGYRGPGGPWRGRRPSGGSLQRTRAERRNPLRPSSPRPAGAIEEV